MKTAISIPDDLFILAEKTAKKLGIPRSQLFAKALEEFIQNHSKDYITARLNQVYSTGPNSLGHGATDVSIHTLRNSLKNDSW